MGGFIIMAVGFISGASHRKGSAFDIPKPRGRAGISRSAGRTARKKAHYNQNIHTLVSAERGLYIPLFYGMLRRGIIMTDIQLTKQIALAEGNPYSGNVLLTFSHNGLEAWGDFIPPTGAGTPLSLTLVRTFLDHQGIVYGVREEGIRAAIRESGTRRRPVLRVLIACGDPPDDEIPEHFKLNTRIFPKPSPSNEKERVDYRAVSPFIIVKKGQTLAYKRPKRPGKEGKNVKAEPIPYRVRENAGVIGGHNTKTGDTYITAEINGQFVQEKNILHVENQLIIKDGVGYKTGHISFPGDILIEGPVSDGFRIYADGSITIKQTLDATEVIARGDLTVAGGIIGHAQGVVKVRGYIKTKFIENCHVACGKTIQVERSISNSTVYAMDTVDLGEKGSIISGDITAIHRIKAAKIGKAEGRGAKLHCGIAFTVQQELEKAHQQLQLLSTHREKAERLITQPDISPEKWAKLDELLKRLREKQHTLNSQIADLLKRIIADEKAAVEVSGEIAPGTLIEICQVGLFVAKPMKKVCIKLDTFYNRLVSEPL